MERYPEFGFWLVKIKITKLENDKEKTINETQLVDAKSVSEVENKVKDMMDNEMYSIVSVTKSDISVVY